MVFDASGKNTQVNLLKEKLEKNNFKVKTYSFPEYNTITGQIIADYLTGKYDKLSKEILCTIFASDRAKRANEINKFLQEDYIVICDRYTYSNLYNIAEEPEKDWDSSIEWLEKLEFECLGVVKPDYNYYLYVDPELSIKRIEERGKREYQDEKEDINESNHNLLKNASRLYMKFAEEENNWVIINEMNLNCTQKSREEISNILYEDVFNKMLENGLLF